MKAFVKCNASTLVLECVGCSWYSCLARYMYCVRCLQYVSYSQAAMCSSVLSYSDLVSVFHNGVVAFGVVMW